MHRSTAPAPSPFNMLPQERKAAAWLASIYALRMFGMFMILPIFSVHAQTLPGGSNLTLVGLAMGIYGLSQACMQIPLGWASDRWGRKPIILGGLAVFALGCLLGAAAHTVEQLIWARALQGAGAISAALSALLADLTRDEVRSKGMAMIGASIGITFALSLALSPVLYQHLGLSGLFEITAALTFGGMVIVAWVLPNAPTKRQPSLVSTPPRTSAAENGPSTVLLNPNLLRLNFGIFMLHLTQMAMFVVVPSVLIHTMQLPLQSHWKVYVPVLLGSFVLMIPLMVRAEKHAQLKRTKMAAIGLLALVALGFAQGSTIPWLPPVLLLAYFVSFNLLEATLPSWVSRVAPPSHRGMALGVYNTAQALGLFAGGALGGAISRHFGPVGVFGSMCICVLLWLWVASGIQALPSKAKPTHNLS